MNHITQSQKQKFSELRQAELMPIKTEVIVVGMCVLALGQNADTQAVIKYSKRVQNIISGLAAPTDDELVNFHIVAEAQKALHQTTEAEILAKNRRLKICIPSQFNHISL